MRVEIHLSEKLVEQIRRAARDRRQWEKQHIYYTKSEAEARHYPQEWFFFDELDLQ